MVYAESDYTHPELMKAREVLARPYGIRPAKVRAACRYASINGDGVDRERAHLLTRVLDREESDEAKFEAAQARAFKLRVRQIMFGAGVVALFGALFVVAPVYVSLALRWGGSLTDLLVKAIL